MGASLSGKSGWQQLQRLFFDHLSHKVGHIRYVNSIPEPSLAAIAVKENHEKLKIFFFALLSSAGNGG